MYLDAKITPSCYEWGIVLFFGMCQGVLLFLADLHWWQNALLILMAMGHFVFWRIKKQPLHTISVKDPAKLWYLGVNDELWQAYLNEVSVIHLGVTKAIRFKFYVYEPIKKPCVMVVFQDSCQASDFRRLSTLANMGGYLS